MATADETKSALDAAEKQLADAKAAHAAALRKDAGPRNPGLILLDFARAVSARFGNHPDLADLVAELTAAVDQPPPPAPVEQGANAERGA